MKKFLAILLSVLMMASCFCMSVSADIIFNDEELDWTEAMGKLSVGSIDDTYVGREIKIPVNIDYNPGIISLKVGVNYDPAVLELVSYEAGNFGSVDGEVPTLAWGDPAKNPFVINWVDPLNTKNNADTGLFATLTFKVKARPESGSTEISLSWDPEDIFSTDFSSIEFTATAGTVTIASHLPGDLDGNGRVTVKDVALLQQYYAGWDVEVVEAAGDMDGNGRITVKDVALLQQYYAGWDIGL